MADTMKFDLVSPERSLASIAATEVRLPGTEGDMTVMAGHSPVITTLRPGIVRVLGGGTIVGLGPWEWQGATMEEVERRAANLLNVYRDGEVLVV